MVESKAVIFYGKAYLESDQEKILPHLASSLECSFLSPTNNDISEPMKWQIL